MKVNQLINFQEIQDVIEIGSIKNEREIVEQYVISPTLEEELLNLLSVLSIPRNINQSILLEIMVQGNHIFLLFFRWSCPKQN